MCGIAGYYKLKGTIDSERFEKMIDIIEHRGPDGRGSFYQNGLALGHRRLSIIDLSKDGHQPFYYMNRYVIVFNGEIYNYMELRDELMKKGYQFETQTDTEVLVASYDCYGKECVHHFNGMWAFAIYDQQKNELYCSRDRFGVKPFYYFRDDKCFIFGSEIKQILYMLNEKPVANGRRLMDFLICGDLDHTEETMFKNIMQLRGGYEILINLENYNFSLNKYYCLEDKKLRRSSYKEDCERFRMRFEKSIHLRLRADVPIGYCLSGGLDSSSIVCMANKQVKTTGHNIEQHAVSSCFEDKEYDEQEYIDEVIRDTNICSHKIFSDSSLLFKEIDKIIWHMDEPFGSTSIYAQWNVFREAKRNGLTVMLDGQGADEQLAGYTSFYGVRFAELLRNGRFITFVNEFKAYKRLRASTEKYVNSTMIILNAVAGAFMPKFVYAKLREYMLASSKLPFDREQLIEVHRNRKLYHVNDVKQYILDSMQCGMPALLHYEDRDSMAFSIESRVPFLDVELAEAIFEMPFESKIRKGISKSVLRDGLNDILPKKIKTRYSKLGFVTPEDKWINEHYTEYRQELVKACNVLNPLLNKKRVIEWFDTNKGKITRGDFMIWRIICAGRWAQVFEVSME